MWNTVWNVLAVIGIMVVICMVCVISLFVIDEFRVRKERKRTMFTYYFNREETGDDRRNETKA